MAIRLLESTECAAHEAELGVVIGRRAYRVSPERAREHVFGFTCVNDVSARDLQRKDKHFTRAKGFDTFCPLGPWIETELPSGPLAITCRVDGEVRQQGSTRDLIFSLEQLLAREPRDDLELRRRASATGT